MMLRTYKFLVKRCQWHGLDVFTQMQTFCHGLRPQIMKMLDASTKGSLDTKIVEEPTNLIEQMASNKNQVQHDKGFPKRVCLKWIPTLLC